MRPLRRKAEYGLPVCDLQLRSYSVENVEFFADFAIRAAYYLNLPVSGPVPLPRIVERWTVPRSNFVHKKSQENFERITLRRLIQIKDGNPKAVQAWLAFLRKHAFYGVGMKANVWEHDSLGTTPQSHPLLAQCINPSQMLVNRWTNLFRRLRRPWARTSPNSVSARIILWRALSSTLWTVTGLLSAQADRGTVVQELESCLSFAFWREPLASCSFIILCSSLWGPPSLRVLYTFSSYHIQSQVKQLGNSSRPFQRTYPIIQQSSSKLYSDVARKD